MSEFNNRMKIQRRVLSEVNRGPGQNEELCGLSEVTLSRWARANGIRDDSEILGLLRAIAEKLSFLATKSQEQVTEEYKNLSIAITRLTDNLEETLAAK